MKKPYPSLRIFKNPILESLTHVHPIIPLMLWGPVTLYWLNQTHSRYQHSGLTYLLWFVVGFLVWTLVEYVLHRIVFHFPAKSKMGKRFVFLFHGLHHDDPKDPTRLVFPPVPAIVIAALLFYGFKFIVPAQYHLLFMVFFMWGYLTYDYIHYATHHFPMTNPIGRFLKKYHLQHHHSHEAVKFGVSSPLWDYVFGTVGSQRGR